MTTPAPVTERPDVAEVFDPEQEPYRGFQLEVARFVDGHFGLGYERQRFESSGAFDAEGWRTLADGGWLSLGLPTSAGGLGDVREVALFQLEAGRAVLNSPFVPAVVQAGLALANRETGPLSDVLSELQAGTTLVTTSIGVEPAGVAFRGTSSATTLVRQGTGFRLSGELKYAQGAHAARWLIAHARTDDQSIVACWPLEDATLDATPAVDGTDLWRVRLDGALAESDQVIASGSRADQLADELADRAALAVAAETVGGSEGCFNFTAEYVKNRVQFGRPVGSFQAIKHRMADLYLSTVLAKNLVFGAVDASLQGGNPTVTSMAKEYSAELYLRMAKAGAQLHAGIGYTWDHNLQFYMRRALTISAMYGDARYHRARVAESLREQAAALK